MKQINLRREPSQVCGFCMRGIQQDEQSTVIQSTDCFHIVHLDCFKAGAKETLLKDTELYCPTCNKEIDKGELKSYLTREEIQEIDEMQMKQFMQENQNLVRCPCGNMMEVEEGQVDFNGKDDKG